MRRAGTGAQAAAEGDALMDAALLLKRASASSHPQVRTFIERCGSAVSVLPVDLSPLVLRAAIGRRLHLLDGRRRCRPLRKRRRSLATGVETVLRKSGELADLEAVAQSWFEDGPDIVQAIAGARGRNGAKVVTYLLQSVIARHRDKWGDLLLRTALWMREAPLELSLCWRELAIVARALADGRDMAEIGLMRDIAQRTLAELASDGRR